MTRDEVKRVLAILNSNYPHVKTTPEEATNRINLWAQTFKDVPSIKVINAVNLHLQDTRVGMFYPTIGHIMSKLQRADDLTALSATARAELGGGIQSPEARAVLNNLTAEFDAADMKNRACTSIDDPCPIEYFKAYRMKLKCSDCPKRLKANGGGR